MPDFENKEKEIFIPGPVGRLQLVTQAGSLTDPPDALQQNHESLIAVICHPHPQMGGTMNNKVVHTLCRTFRDMGVDNLRFNFRGVEASEGEYDNAVGETEDLLAIIHWCLQINPNARFILAGFSFGSFVAANGAKKLWQDNPNQLVDLILVAPPVPRMDFAELTPLPFNCLVVQGTEDEVVPAQSVYDWCEQNSARVQLEKLEGASHFFHGKLTVLKKIVSDRYS